MKCLECHKEKELTVHGTCWKCHLGSVQFNTMIEVRKNLSTRPAPSKIKADDIRTIESN